ncbi:zinc finger MYM-type protein 1-like [Olea europaea var. sylvestris]|uniref:zinc finger MYM-type protein 1-like n=1 Tax=Olea europaea var. sylvestris TaxID=158386 RepID=UPI000C1D56F9|nr:zinc finger MYM-type protein 1-like [Olea europaea var. sylvestris]
MNQKQSISHVISSQSSSQQKIYRTRLTAVLDCTRFLLMQGLSSRGHDESKESLNKGNLIKLLNWYATCRKKINEVLFSNAPGNDQMTSPNIHKDLVNCCAVETIRSMINEMGDSLFSILVDESRDNSVKEQMAVVLRFVDKSGQVKEPLLGICHIADTCAQSLKDAIDAMFSTHGLSISSLRGQGYDGASNMSATASVERVFSAMNLIKNDLRNKMGDEMLNDNLVVYMERDLFMKLENETILQRFQNMRPRRIQLSKLAISE